MPVSWFEVLNISTLPKFSRFLSIYVCRMATYVSTYHTTNLATITQLIIESWLATSSVTSLHLYFSCQSIWYVLYFCSEGDWFAVCTGRCRVVQRVGRLLQTAQWLWHGHRVSGQMGEPGELRMVVILWQLSPPGRSLIFTFIVLSWYCIEAEEQYKLGKNWHHSLLGFHTGFFPWKRNCWCMQRPHACVGALTRIL